MERCSIQAEQIVDREYYCTDLLNAKVDADNSQANYYAAVERLTAKSWREG
jgi:hypothetical protein